MELLRFIPRQSWAIMALASIAGLVAGASNVALVAAINACLQAPLPHQRNQFIFASVVVLAARLVSVSLTNGLIHLATSDLRTRMIRRLLMIPVRDMERIGVAPIMAALSDDLSIVAGALGFLPGVCSSAAVAIGTVVYLSILSPKLLGLVGVTMVVAAALHATVLGPLRRLNIQRARERDELTRGIESLVRGAKELKLHRPRRENLFNMVLRPAVRRVRDFGRRADQLSAISSSLVSTSYMTGIGLVAILGGTLLGLPAAARSGAALAMLFLSGPLDLLVNSLGVFSRGNVAVRNLQELGGTLARSSDDAPSSSNLTTLDKWETLTLSDVTSQYYNEREIRQFVLGPIDLTIRRGQIVFIVGGNGSGKSTLAKIITGLYVPDSGSITLDNREINNDSREWYRQHFTALFTDFQLFTDLRLLGTPEVGPRAMHYLKRLQLDHKVTVENGVLSTTALSTGQRKRLALLTAYLENRPILVLDEVASDQDPVFKNFFYTEMLPELRDEGKTIICITHDDRYFPLADEVIKIDEGKISEEATSQFMWKMTQ